MTKTLFPEIIFNHYPSGETSFASRLSDPSQITPTADFNQMLQRISAALINKNSLVVVIVRGHSDRVDEPNLDIVQKKNRELDASRDRCVSVMEHIESTICAMNSITVDDIKHSTHYAIQGAPFGSGHLKNNFSVLSPEQRLENRRVEIIHYEFTLY
jgi:flagellar motor protein MotB